MDNIFYRLIHHPRAEKSIVRELRKRNHMGKKELVLREKTDCTGRGAPPSQELQILCQTPRASKVFYTLGIVSV